MRYRSARGASLLKRAVLLKAPPPGFAFGSATLPMKGREKDQSVTGMIVTLSPHPQASVSFGFRNTNFDASCVVS